MWINGSDVAVSQWRDSKDLTMVVLLRRTNRLAMHLASNGHALYQADGYSDEWVLHLANPIEVEFFTSSTTKITRETRWAFPFLTRTGVLDMMSWLSEADSDGIADNAGNFPFPPQTDRLFSQISDLLHSPSSHCDRDTGYEILPFQEESDHGHLLERMKHFSRHDEADILWLSATEFVSFRWFSARLRELGLYSSNSYAMSVGMCTFFAYSLPQLDNANGVFQFAPVSDLPLRFIYHSLAAIFQEISSLKIEIAAATPVDAALALIPRTNHNPMNNTTIKLPCSSTELLRALASFSIHHRVRLLFEEASGGIPPQELNDLLLQFRFPVHLQIPRTLLDFECENEPFTANPSFTSLTFSSCRTPLSTRMLNGIGHNKGMKHLVIDCWDWDYRRNDMAAPSVIKAVFRGALQGGTASKILTLVSRYENNARGSETDESEPPKSVLEAFERLGEDLLLTSQKRHCVAQLLWTFPRSRGMPRLKSNKLWDSEFSPALVLNCLHRQPGGCPPAILLGMASRRINQGIVFEYATNLVPWDLAASNASAIFEALYHSVDYDWLQKGEL
jgi:hypothetical protein